MNVRDGQPAPDLRLRTPDGEWRQLTDLTASGPVLLAIYKTTCPTCQLALPFLTRLKDAGLQIFTVSQDSPAASRQFNQDYDVDLPFLLDRADDGYPASNALGVTHVPSLLLIGQDRRVDWSDTGFSKRNLETLAARFGRKMFTGADKVPESKSG
jgi:peroxiredoxin